MSLPELNKESIAFGLKVFSTTALGLYAGQSLYINAVEVPANLDHEPEHSLQNWQRNFHHASHFAPKVHGAGVLAAVGHYLLTRGTDNEDLPFLLSQLIGELNVPITFGIIMPVNNQLHDQDDCKTKGGAHIRNLLQQWNYRHGFRTALGIGTFAYCVYRIAKGTN
ncbi:uncharacterized protein LOC130624249 isoform X2 [Hydractinia symbiolongicarpus]|uniref:uncharacterized protein LOC130624249 isoform X2 n=1 Tax=Hydractinia symbiolongicarpus TaxID=13093 RepID=UPI00254E90E2|nr:uncharacterized protein LOC130624249 isoform X2 [Hydractinia symbiolongicarpus]